jgi:hypothetical protein
VVGLSGLPVEPVAAASVPQVVELGPGDVTLRAKIHERGAQVTETDALVSQGHSGAGAVSQRQRDQDDADGQAQQRKNPEDAHRV